MWLMNCLLCFPQDIYCLDADGALFDAALLSAVAAFSHRKIAHSQCSFSHLSAKIERQNIYSY